MKLKMGITLLTVLVMVRRHTEIVHHQHAQR